MKRLQLPAWGSSYFEVGSALDVRRWIWITLLSSLGVLLLGLLSASPLAERQARAEAEKRGLAVEMEDFRLGWFEAELSKVQVRLTGVPNISVHIERVLVEFSLGSPRLRSILAEDGKVAISGSVNEVRSSLSKWRDSRPKVGPAREKRSPTERTEILRRFEIEWIGAFENSDKQIVSGLNVERGPKGLRVGADLVEAASSGLSAQVAGSLLQAQSPSFDLSQAEKLGATEMRITYNTPEEESPEEEQSTQGQGAQPKAPGKPDALATSSSKDGDDLESDDADAGLGDSIEKDSDRVVRLAAFIKFLREKVQTLLPPRAQVDRLWFTYRRGDEKLHVGPSLLTLEKQKGDLVMQVTPRGSARGTPLSLALTVLPESAPVAMKVALKGGPVSLSTLGVSEGAFGLSGVSDTQLSGTVSAELDQGATTISGGGEAFVEGLAIDSPRLSDNLVTFPKLTLSGKGVMHIDGTLLRVEEAKMHLGEAGFLGAFEVQGGDAFVTLKARAAAPLVSCQALLDSAPRGLLGAAEQMNFEGTFSLDLNVEADTRKLSDMKVRWDFKNGCRVTKVPAELDPDQFRGLFRREVVGAGGFPVDLEFGPLSTNWVPWEEVSPYVEKALLVTEDGRFFRHRGFDDRAIESAIRANVKSGHFVRGASTISMQLAKNLYLSRKKTLARKFQEAALTSLLEQNFEKDELLELYVNVVEFGPGIYGIRRAAEHYFQTTPDRLTAAQSFFLASVLPAPTRQYFEEGGSLNPARANLVRRLLTISHSREALTETELEEALEEQLVFGEPRTLPEKDDSEGEAENAPREEREKSPTLNPSPFVDEPIFPAR